MADLSVDLVSLSAGIRATEYMCAACAALWAYDYFLTLDRELKLVWRSRWSLGKVAFFLNRYSPITVIALVNYYFHGVANHKNCHRVFTSILWFYVIGFLWSNVVLAMRAWAIWGGNRTILVVLTILLLVNFIPVIVLIHRLSKLIIQFESSKITCLPYTTKRDLYWPEFMLFIINETATGALALTKGIQHYRLSYSPLIVIMFHDGLLYYIYSLLLATAVVIVTIVAPSQWAFFLQIPLGVLSSIFATRVLLNIRGVSHNTTYVGRSATSFSLRPLQVDPSTQSWIWMNLPSPPVHEVEMAEVSGNR